MMTWLGSAAAAAVAAWLGWLIVAAILVPAVTNDFIDVFLWL